MRMGLWFSFRKISCHLCILDVPPFGFNCEALKECASRYNHNPTSQKGCRTTKKNNQNWINIYVLSFKTMTIMANYCFFIHMNVKEFKPKIHLMKFFI
jgi:hypothetical protein